MSSVSVLFSTQCSYYLQTGSGLVPKNCNVIHENFSGGFPVCLSKGVEQCWVWQREGVGDWALEGQRHREFVSVCANYQSGSLCWSAWMKGIL